MINRNKMTPNSDAPLAPEALFEALVTTPMPFGKYKGTLICNLPETYLLWFRQQGFPKGKLGMLLATCYEIKLNGLEHLLVPFRNKMRR